MSKLSELLKKYKLVAIILALIFLGLVLVISGGNSKENKQVKTDQNNANTASQSKPKAFTKPISSSQWSTDSFTNNTNLSYKVPQDWTKTTSTEQGVESAKYRSPTDDSGFYYCVELREYPENSTKDLSMTADIVAFNTSFTANGIGKPINLVTYRAADENGFHTTIIDDTSVKNGTDVIFNESITNPLGRRLQWIGQYNCDNPTDVAFDNYIGGEQYMTALKMGLSLAY